MVSIEISSAIKSKLPGLQLGCIEAQVSVGTTGVELQSIIDSELTKLQEALTPEIIRETTTVKATKDAYRALGKDPNRYRPAAESLMRRVANGKGLYQISNVVDILNLLSVQTGFSICGYDRDSISGKVVLGIGESEEPYQGIGRGDVNIEKLPVFRDETSAFGTPTSDSTRTMIGEDTKHVLFVFVDFGNSNSLEIVLADCVNLLDKFAGASEVTQKIL